MEDRFEVEIGSLKEMAKAENNPDMRMSIYDALASYGPRATGALLELAKLEADGNAKEYALSRIKQANERKGSM